MSTNPTPKTLDELLESRGEKMKKLFLKVMNLHAGYQIIPIPEKELLASIRKEIEEGCGHSVEP